MSGYVRPASRLEWVRRVIPVDDVEATLNELTAQGYRMDEPELHEEEGDGTIPAPATTYLLQGTRKVCACDNCGTPKARRKKT